MDTSFVVAVAAALGFASLLIACRMRASGASGRRIAILVAELWAAFAVWIVVFASLQDMGHVWAACALAASIIVVAHLLWSLKQVMRGGISG